MGRRASRHAFTLIELLIVIAIIGILVAILTPNLLTARARAFDTGAQACLKEVGTSQEAIRADFPFDYDASFDPMTILTCTDVTFLAQTVTPSFYSYEASHASGLSIYRVETGTSVFRIGP